MFCYHKCAFIITTIAWSMNHWHCKIPKPFLNWIKIAFIINCIQLAWCLQKACNLKIFSQKLGQHSSNSIIVINYNVFNMIGANVIKGRQWSDNTIEKDKIVKPYKTYSSLLKNKTWRNSPICQNTKYENRDGNKMQFKWVFWLTFTYNSCDVIVL